MQTFQQIITALTALVMALSAQVANLNHSISPTTQVAQVISAPTSGLVGYWNFDEGSGTAAYDSSGNGNNGTITNATWTTGKMGQALSFDGNDNVAINDSDTFNFSTGNFSASAWVYPTGSTNFQPILNFTNNLVGGWILEDIGALNWVDFVTGSNQRARSQSFTRNTWHNVIGVRNGTTLSIYVDGIKGSDATVNPPDDVNTNPYDGVFKFGYGWMGKIDDVRIYSRALSAQEALDIYNDTQGGHPPPSGDTQAPSVPTNLSAAAVSSSQISLSWTASTDNVGVTGYRIYRGGTQIGTSGSTSYADSNLSASTNYSYAVSAYDAAGNNSGQSTSVSATTQPSVVSGDPCPSTVSTGVTTCYFIANGGNDSAAGTKAAPWAHLPYMRTWTGTHTPAAGEGFILKGGNTWTAEDLAFQWLASGNASHRIYIGVDPSWYSGGSWARPIFTCLDSSGAQQECTVRSSALINVIQIFGSYVTVDNIEFTKVYMGSTLPNSNNSVGAVSLAALYDEVKNSYCHGWGHDPSSTGNISCFNTYTGGGTMAVLGTSIHDNVVDGSDTAMDDGTGIENAQYVYNNVVTYTVGGIEGKWDYMYNNLVEHVDFWAYNGAHCNEAYHKGPIDTSAKVVRIQDNIIRNSSAAGCVVFFVNNLVDCPTCTSYVYNNLIYGLTNGNNPVMAVGQIVNHMGTEYFYNNTIIPQSSYVSCIGNGNAGPPLGTAVFDNNHCITTTGGVCFTGGAVTCTDGGHNLKQTAAQAAANYNSALATYAYSPLDTSAQGISAGANLASLVSTIGAPFGSDTTYAVGYDAVNHKVIAAQRTGIPRPTSAPWDIGAYQVSSGGTPLPADTSPLSIPSGLTATAISNLLGFNTTNTTTQISWNTNISTNGQIFYGTTASYGTQSSLVDNSVRTTSHNITLTGLISSTLYHFKVTSIDASGNSVSSGDFTFTTLSTSVIPPPTAPPPTNPPSSGGGSPITVYIPPAATSTSTGTSTISLDQLRALLASLLKQVADLQAQFAAKLKGTTTSTSITTTFNRNLSLGMTGSDVKQLQQFLNTHGFTITKTGSGSPGKETTLFGTMTYKSLKAFQASVNLPSTGLFGPMTREYVNSH